MKRTFSVQSNRPPAVGAAVSTLILSSETVGVIKMDQPITGSENNDRDELNRLEEVRMSLIEELEALNLEVAENQKRARELSSNLSHCKALDELLRSQISEVMREMFETTRPGVDNRPSAAMAKSSSPVFRSHRKPPRMERRIGE